MIEWIKQHVLGVARINPAVIPYAIWIGHKYWWALLVGVLVLHALFGRPTEPPTNI
jgi:hypothetical protein